MSLLFIDNRVFKSLVTAGDTIGCGTLNDQQCWAKTGQLDSGPKLVQS